MYALGWIVRGEKEEKRIQRPPTALDPRGRATGVWCVRGFGHPGRSGLPEAAGEAAGKGGSEGNGTRARPNPYTRATEGPKERDSKRPNGAKLQEPQARARASETGPRAPHKSGVTEKKGKFKGEGGGECKMKKEESSRMNQ